MKKSSLFITLFLFNFSSIYSFTINDTLHGKVVLLLNNGETENPAVGASLYWLGNGQKVYTNPLAEFNLPLDGERNELVVSYPNFATDTIVVNNLQDYIVIKLVKITSKKLNGVVVQSQKAATEISYLSTVQLLKINSAELHKAACCNLSESFETTPSVDVNFTDAITGQKQIQMLGLATPYTLITQENIPTIRGLASIVGLNLTPGTWVQGMQLTKGTGSVVNGFESLSGQINVELQKPDHAEKLYLNLYQNSGGRSEANLNIAHQWNKKLASGLLLHYKNQWYKQDMNMDGFLDNPLGDQKIALYRMQYYADNGLEVQGGIKVSSVNNSGGQMHHTVWQFTSDLQRNEAWLKIGKVNKQKPWQSMGLQLAGFMHQQQLQTPNHLYNGTQNNFYANYIYQGVIGNTNHQYKIGTSVIVDAYKESMPDTIIKQLNRLEKVPGIYAEHTYNYLDKLTIVTGLRADYHNLYGAFITPRLHLRYLAFTNTTMRVSLGRAQRTASVLAENQQAYFSNRQFVFKGAAPNWQQGLQPEVAWNAGYSLVQPFKLNYRKGTIMLDYYYSWFSKQIIADYETPRQVQLYNLAGKSNSQSIQAQIDYEAIRKKLDIRLAYRYYNIQTTFGNTTLQKPLISTQRGFINAAYHTKSKWNVDATVVVNGAKRLPNYFANQATDTSFSMQKSPAFVTINSHISKAFKNNIEIYIGAENMTNYMQSNAIISAANPTGQDFDASQTWGPVMGINGYVGLRWIVK
jgi:outer membrane receptor for ferrienterochelin and colicins